MREKRRFYFSDETENFRRPAEPADGESVVLRLRAAEGDSFHAWVISSQGQIPMERAGLDGSLPVYEAKIPGLSGPFRYLFEIEDGEGTVYYGKCGLQDTADFANAFWIFPGFQIPEWMQGAVIYQIFVDRFCNGDLSNDVEEREYFYLEGGCAHRVMDWNTMPEPLDVRNFYGGDLKGVWDQLDYLQYLGVEVLYFNPLFVSPSNHKYDTQDYEHIDPHVGKILEDGGEVLPEGADSNHQATKYIKRTTSQENLEASDAFFAEFVEEAHRRGIRVILDGVFNHCGSFHKWMDRAGFYRDRPGYEPGAYGRPDSPYRNFFRFGQDESYESWWGMETLPKLNYEGDPRLKEEILQIGRKWISPPYSADGWRLDVAADLGHSPEENHKFWREFRRAVKEANPEAVILAEHYGDISPWMDGSQWDTVMNYDAFMEPVSWFLTGMEKHSNKYREELLGNGEAFWAAMIPNMARFPSGSLYAAMNQLDNHDHSRFVTRTSRRTGRLGADGTASAEEGIDLGVCREAAVMQMTWPGAPTLYYGNETALPGWTDPDSRRPFPWGKENWEMIEFYRELIKIHKNSPALLRGSLVRLLGEHELLAYGRFLGEERMVVVIHNGPSEGRAEIPVELLGGSPAKGLIRLIETGETGYNIGAVRLPVREGKAAVPLRPVSAAIYRVE